MPSKEKGAGKMDTFMDKFAQRKKAQGMIDANAAADAAKMEKLQKQVNEYELLLQEMRKVNLKTAENAGQMRKVLQTWMERLEALQIENAAQAERDQILSEIKNRLEELPIMIGEQWQEELLAEMKLQQDATAEEAKRQMEEAFRQNEEFFHKESVKVYRNVQAAMTEELEKQTETLSLLQTETGRKQKGVLPLTVLTLILLLADIAIHLFSILNIKLF